MHQIWIIVLWLMLQPERIDLTDENANIKRLYYKYFVSDSSYTLLLIVLFTPCRFFLHTRRLKTGMICRNISHFNTFYNGQWPVLFLCGAYTFLNKCFFLFYNVISETPFSVLKNTSLFVQSRCDIGIKGPGQYTNIVYLNSFYQP